MVSGWRCSERVIYLPNHARHDGETTGIGQYVSFIDLGKKMNRCILRALLSSQTASQNITELEQANAIAHFSLLGLSCICCKCLSLLHALTAVLESFIHGR